MQIKEIPFTGRLAPADATDITRKIGRGWSAPIKLPLPIRINGALCQYVNISAYCGIRFAEAKNGDYHYMPGDRYLPEDLTNLKDGYLLIPWGELQKFSCGCSVKLWQVGGIVCISFDTKSQVNDRKFMYRVEFGAGSTANVYYYHCVSGYDTVVGAALDPTDTEMWPIKETRPYMKKALKFTLKKTERLEDPPIPTPDNKPFGPQPVVNPLEPKPVVNPLKPKPESYWLTKYIDDDVRLSVKK